MGIPSFHVVLISSYNKVEEESIVMSRIIVTILLHDLQREQSQKDAKPEMKNRCIKKWAI